MPTPLLTGDATIGVQLGSTQEEIGQTLMTMLERTTSGSITLKLPIPVMHRFVKSLTANDFKQQGWIPLPARNIPIAQWTTQHYVAAFLVQAFIAAAGQKLEQAFRDGTTRVEYGIENIGRSGLLTLTFSNLPKYQDLALKGA
jgi:hypothetical protein